MNALPKILIILAVWFVYTLVLFQGCSDTLCVGCGEGASATGAVVPPEEGPEAVEERTYPLSFRWNSAAPITANGAFSRFKDSLMAGSGDENLLEITGLYFEEETTPEGYDNMGFARAAQVRELMSDEIDSDRVQLRARLIDERSGVREQAFEGALFEWMKPEEQIAETVEELPDRVNIRFPYNSVQKEYDPEVEAYLVRLVDDLRETEHRILLTGHADNSGTAEYNYDLGLRRAREMREFLVRGGVAPDRIEVQSRGETQPIASNETEEGRHENRRVEIRILKNPSNQDQ